MCATVSETIFMHKIAIESTTSIVAGQAAVLPAQIVPLRSQPRISRQAIGCDNISQRRPSDTCLTRLKPLRKAETAPRPCDRHSSWTPACRAHAAKTSELDAMANTSCRRMRSTRHEECGRPLASRKRKERRYATPNTNRSPIPELRNSPHHRRNYVSRNVCNGSKADISYWRNGRGY